METSSFFLYMSFVSVLASEPSTLHNVFTKKELTETFGLDDHDSVPVYETTKVRGNIKLNDDIPTSLSLKAFGKEFNLNVSPNKDFISDAHTTEFVDKDGNIEKYVGVLGEFSFGNVVDDPSSHVSLHHTGRGLSGSIRTSDDLYMINPLPHRHRNDYDDEQADHVIYRASDNTNDPTIKKIMTTKRDFEKKYDVHRRSRRSLRDDLPKKTIELLIAGDWRMLELHGKEFLPTYMFAIINMMSGYFRDVTLEYPVDVVVVRSVIFETDIMNATNMDSLLTAFSSWCHKNNNYDDDNSKDHFDTALLMSKDGCSQGCGIVGLANFRAACSPNSQAVGMDRGFMTAVILAHELGHVLGSSHDGLHGEYCPNSVHIMASGGTKGGGATIQWSNCSSSAIAKTLRTATCFDDANQVKITDSKFQLYGTVYNADKQCEYTYSNKFQRCIFEEDLCAAMSCNRIGSHSCVGRLFPALHGTPCGQDKWCIFGVCVPNGGRKARLAKKLDGGWSQWSEYSSCNEPCNVGVQWRNRTCTDPTPVFDGSLCKTKRGELATSEEGHYRTCNQERCEKNTPPEDLYYSDRDAQCKEVKKGSDFCKYCRGISPCSLWCGSQYSGVYSGSVKTGTVCKVSDKNGICVAGECVVVGCDYVLNSGEKSLG